VKELLKKGSIVVVLGPGGVGKTTVAAALGVAAARAGLDTGVITVDPARRLRDALGLERLSARPRRLDSRRLRRAGLDPELKLSAMVLDAKRTWDRLVSRFISRADARQRVLENPFYRNLTKQFPGAESYAVLEQLYDLHASGRFDVTIVDTPPAAHAFEFIQAPAHLVRLLDSRAARWLFVPYASVAHGALGAVDRVGRFVMRQLANFAGAPMLAEVSKFFAAAGEAADDISARFRKTELLLRLPNVQFVLVTTPEEDRLREAGDVLRQLTSEGLRLGAVALNRMLDERTFDAFAAAPRRIPTHLAEITALRKRLLCETTRDRRLDALVRHLECYRSHQCDQIERVVRFARELPSSILLTIAPEVEVGVRDLHALANLALDLVTNSGAGSGFLENAAAALRAPEPTQSGVLRSAVR
jgi:anion-transporting  ArsA/GET3 family ATPase